MKKLIPLAFTLVLALIPALSGCGGSGGGGINTYTLNISVENGPGCAVTPASGRSYPAGTVVTLQLTCATGYGLDHWGGTDGTSVTQSPTTREFSIVMNGNKNISAVFATLKYDLEVDTDGNGSVAVSLVPGSRDAYAIEHGQTVSLIAQTNPGYVFASWSGGLTGGANPASLTMTGPLTGTGKVTAHFVRNLLHGHMVGKNSLHGMAGVTVTVGGQTAVTDVDGYWEVRGVTYPATVTASVAPESGYLCAWFSPASVTVDDGESDVRIAMTAYVFERMWGIEGSGNGQFESPTGVAVDAAGHVYVADRDNQRIQKFDSNGAWVGVIGGPDFYVNGHWGFIHPLALALEPDGSEGFVLDWWQNGIDRFNCEAFFYDGSSDIYYNYNIHTQIAGAIARGANRHTYVSDGMSVYILDYPDGAATKWRDFGTGAVSGVGGIAIDRDGVLYVTDGGNNRVLKVGEYGSYLGEWGSPGAGDGQFDGPGVIAVNAGVVCVYDARNYRVEVFTTNGVFLGQWGTEGSGAGKFKAVGGIAVDSNGTIFTADRENNCIQKFKCVD